MAKTTNLSIRIEPGLKEQSEEILGKLGIPMSNAINIFLKQVVIQRGIPFSLKLSIEKPVGIGAMTNDELEAAIEVGLADLTNGNVKSAELVMADLRRDYNL